LIEFYFYNILFYDKMLKIIDMNYLTQKTLNKVILGPFKSKFYESQTFFNFADCFTNNVAD